MANTSYELRYLLRWSAGRPISTSIQDGQFIQRIQDGEKFGNGHSLVVDLEISQKYNEGYDTYIIDKYTVLMFGTFTGAVIIVVDQGHLFQQ